MNQSETDLGIVNESQLLRLGITVSSGVERSRACLAHGTHGLNEASGALPMCRANDPRSVSPAMVLFKPALLT